MQQVLEVVQTINSYLSDYVLILLLIVAGLFFTVRTRFVQIRCFGEGMKKVFANFSMHGDERAGGLSSFQALATAIAAQVGTGNIVGAAGAILTGGPGAIFWMWVIAFFGMATIYAEAVLAQDTRVTMPDGSIAGGPVYYIKKALPGAVGSFLAVFFSVATIIALGFTGCMVQSNSIASTCASAFGISPMLVGVAVAVVAGFVFIGGISRIARVTEKLVPIMAGLYIIGGIAVLISRAAVLPEAIGMIFRYAFAPEAIIGGTFGTAIKIAVSQGAKRGLFSNEAGMGSTPHAHAVADVKRPHDQGVVAMIGVFIDTFIVLTMTALVVISVLYAGGGPLASGAAEGIDRTNMAQLAFSSLMGEGAGGKFVAVCLLFFAFSTILSWNFFGRINAQFLFGSAGVKVYTVISLLFVLAGSMMSNDLVWELSDMFNQLMVLPNVFALITLGAIVANEANKPGELKR